ncbi:MAG: hypothetical protein ABSG05_00460 [Candidatus Pacearchaeota archaeon]|jgi:hypothetical protein
MSFLGFGKKKKILDLTEGYSQAEKVMQANQAKRDAMTSSSTENSFSGTTPFSVFDSPGAMNSSSGSDDFETAATPEERKKRLAKRILNMTERIEDLSNQVYHLQQRVEVLEKKANITSSEY